MSFNFFTSPGDRYMVGQRPTSITSSTWSWILWLKPDWQRLAESTNLWPMSISNAWNTSGDYTHQYAAQYEKFVGADSYGCLVYDTGQSGINASVRDQDGTCSGWVPLVCRVFSDSLQKAAAMTFNSQNQLSEANSVNNTMNYLALGTVKGHAGAWDGKLGEFGLWDVALSDAETTALLKGARPDSIRPRNMVAYHPMRRLDGIYSRDESPSNYRKWDVAVAFPSYSWPNLLSLNDNPPVFVPTNRDLRSWLQSKKYFIPTPVWETVSGQVFGKKFVGGGS